MKRIVLASAIGLMSLSAFGQDALEKAMVDQLRKDKEKSDNSISDAKSNVKAAYWVDRAKTYEDIALKASQLDSVASKTALAAYKKVVELDLTKKGEPGKSAKEAQKALKGEEGTMLFHSIFKQGTEQYQVKNLPSALQLFKTALEINPKDTTVALYGGVTANQIDNKEEAKSLWEMYAANGGKDPSVFYGLAQVYRTENNFEKALATLNKGLERSPGNKDLKSEIVNIMLVGGREPEAITQLEAMVKEDPKNSANLLNLAVLYDNINRKTVDRIKEVNTKLGAGTTKVASLTKELDSEKGKLEAIEGEIKRLGALIKKQPKNADLKRQLTENTTRRDEAKAAVAKLDGDIKASQESAKGNDVAALEKEFAELKEKKTKSAQEAEAYYKKVLEVEPTNADGLYNLGVWYFNEAVIMKGEVDNMTLSEYQQRGKEVEGRVCGRFKKSKPYFERAIQAKDLAEAKDNLAVVDKVLEEFAGKSITCIEE
ncbi:tetratricopeptide repeat protein [Dyadobacter sp. 32]|uniref:tetratricopeptide repeat protein n=1 Tax=Dyadobacter sp. 32 TaxID=538966 RepID=UPI0011EBC0B5